MPTAYLPAGLSSAGLALLLDAYDSALDVNGERWDFAVEISLLLRAGISGNALRWLICKGFAEHGVELLPRDGNAARRIRPVKWLKFEQKSRVVLSKAGAEFVRPLCRKSAADTCASLESAGISDRSPGTATSLVPVWDADRRILALRGEIILRLSRRAKNLVLIVQAFQDDHWPPRIDDPLPGVIGREAKSRLRGAIEKLNRKRLVKRIHF
ncbi:MAG TPA: hypothetical protein VKU82_09785, partial [Planctomycetaceae bacterium]|nr:hypothetical protein [Planctomycetaceae bacterium]